MRNQKLMLFTLVIFLLSAAIPVLAQEKDLMEMSLEELMNLTITTASKSAQKVSDAPSIVSVITQEEMKNMGAQNLEEVLRTVVGLSVRDNSMVTTPAVQVRGVSGTMNQDNRILVLLNGQPIRSNYTLDTYYFINDIPLNIIKQVEIIRGPGSALYGANAFVGVINIITREADNNLDIAFSGGSFNTINTSLLFTHKGSDDKFKATLFGSLFNTDGAQRNIEKDMPAVMFGPIAQMIGYPMPVSSAPGPASDNIKNYTMGLNLKYSDVFLNAYHINNLNGGGVGIGESLTQNQEARSNFTLIELGYKNSFDNDKGELSIKSYYDNSVWDLVCEIFTPEATSFLSLMPPFAMDHPYPAGVGLMARPIGKAYTLGSEINLSYDFTKYLGLLAGAVYERSTQYDQSVSWNGNGIGVPMVIDGVTYGPFDYLGGMIDVSEDYNWNVESERNITALFAQSTINLLEALNLNGIGTNLTLTAGIRYDSYDDIGSSVNPRLGFVYAPSEDMYFKLLYGQAFRAPGENSELYCKNNPARIGNPNLKPEKLTSFEAMVGFNLTKSINLQATYYNMSIKDGIETTGANNIFANAGIFTMSGFEAEAKMILSQGSYTYANFTYQNVINTSGLAYSGLKIVGADTVGVTYNQDDYSPGLAPKIIANVGVNFPLTENIGLNVSGNYTGEVLYSEIKQVKADYSGQTELIDQRDPIPSRFLLNASVRFHSFSFAPNLEFQLSGYNLLNVDHRDPTSMMIPYGLPRAGISFRGNISYRL